MARLAATRRFLVLWIAVAVVACAAPFAHAATIYWDGTGTATWNSTSNWSTASNATTPNPAAIPNSSDDVIFNISTVNANTLIDLGGDRAALSLTFNNTGTTQFRGNASGTTARTLTIGTGGITLAAGAGAVTISTGSNGTVNLTLAGSQSIANNSSSKLAIAGTVSGSSSPTLTNNGTGTGVVEFAFPAAIGSTVTKLVQDSATSTLALRTGSPLFTGGVEVRKGTLAFGNSPDNLGSGTLTLGNAAGGSDAVTVELYDNGNVSFANQILLASNTTGTLTIRLLEDQVGTSHSKTFTGGITGSNSFRIQNDGGDDTITFSTGAINNTGTITHIGTGSGATTISSVIGTNVTGLTQNSSTSRLVLGGTNTYSGPTTISAGMLELAAGGSFANSGTISVAPGGLLDLTSKTSGFAFGSGQTLAGSGSVSLPTSGSGVSLAGFLAPGTVTAGTLAFTGAGTFDITSAITSQTGRLEFGLDAPGVSDLVTVASGTLSMGSGLLNFDDFSFSNLGGLDQGTYTLFSAGSLSGSLGSNLSGSIGGGFTGTLQTSGNTIQLVVVPEPAGIALAGLGMAAAALVRRFCRRDEPTADARS
jgi:autotransporter-associated beta strand protein